LLRWDSIVQEGLKGTNDAVVEVQKLVFLSYVNSSPCQRLDVFQYMELPYLMLDVTEKFRRTSLSLTVEGWARKRKGL
jgi:hypothetical protein